MNMISESDLVVGKEQGKIPHWLTLPGYQTLKKGYLLEGEYPIDMYKRLANSAAKTLKKPQIANAFFELFWNNWLCPSTPVACNLGSERGLPISCFGGLILKDSISGIMDGLKEVAMQSKAGGGTAIYAGNIRARGSKIKNNGASSGVIPFLKMFDAVIMGVNQGSSRRGSMAAYLPITHGDAEDFMNMRRHTVEHNLQVLNLHHGICIEDDFMTGLKAGGNTERTLWYQLMKARLETGEPYMFFSGNANRGVKHKVWSSNLCVAPETEILTKEGHQIISLLENKEVEIWNGTQWSKTKVVKTGENQKLIKVVFSNGKHLDCTPYHKFYIQEGYDRGTGENALKIYQKQASELRSGDKIIKFTAPVMEFENELEDAYTQGFFSGDGCRYKERNHIDLYGEKKELIPFLNITKQSNETGIQKRIRVTLSNNYEKYYVPLKHTIKSRLNWFEGLCDSDGCVLDNNGTKAIQIASIHKEFLLSIQDMLQTLGIQSKVIKAADAREVYLPDSNRNKKLYSCKASSRLLIGAHAIQKLKSLGFSPNRLKLESKIPNRNAEQFIKVISVIDENRYDATYCVNEPIAHKAIFNGIITGNCNEIYLPTDEEQTFVCCLSSLNLARYDEWKDTNAVELSTWFLDAVMTEFMEKAIKYEGLEKALKFSEKYRALGLGVLGWHNLLQSKLISFESFQAMQLNNEIFAKIKRDTDKASRDLGKEYGIPSGCEEYRNYTRIAIAPTVSNALISGNLSQGVEPINANSYLSNNAKLSYVYKNSALQKVLQEKGKDEFGVWLDISSNQGSVQQLKFLSDEEKDIFKTAREINQKYVIQQAAQRQQYIDQGQSINLFFPSNAPISYINKVHLMAYNLGLKGLYYCRTESALKGTQAIKLNDDSVCKSCEG